MQQVEQKTWEELGREVRERALAIARAILRHKEDAEDALQEWELQACRLSGGLGKRGPELGSEERRKAYLKGMMRNIARRLARKRNKQASCSLSTDDLAEDCDRASPRASSVAESMRDERLKRDVLRLLETFTALEEADSENCRLQARRLERLAKLRANDAELSNALLREANACDKRTWRFRVLGSIYMAYERLKSVAAQIAQATGRADISPSWVDHLKSDTLCLVRAIAMKTGADLWVTH
jgi:DNA-directed RNA polymerase specialized sigma24 family protein